MNKVFAYIAVLCGTMFFSISAYASEVGANHESSIMAPIIVAAESTEAFTNEDIFKVGNIIITETAANMFSDNQQFCFFIKHEPLKIETNRICYVFEEKAKTEISEETLKAVYEVEDGKLFVSIKNSDPTKVESFSIPNLTVKKNEPYGILHTYMLYLSSDANENFIPVVHEFFSIEEYVPPIPQKPLDIEIRINEMTLLVNQQKKDLKVPAYISDIRHIMLPVRELAEVFPGMIVLWDNEKKETTILHGADIIIITVGTEDIKYISENRILLRGAEIKDGRMFINLRDMCKIYGVKDNEILWDADEKVVTINTTVNDNSER